MFGIWSYLGPGSQSVDLMEWNRGEFTTIMARTGERGLH